MATKKVSILDTLSEAVEHAPSAPAKKVAPKVDAKPSGAETVATRSYVGGPWEPFIEGQVPGPNGVIAIKFADGSEWDLGYGWLTK